MTKFKKKLEFFPTDIRNFAEHLKYLHLKKLIFSLGLKNEMKNLLIVGYVLKGNLIFRFLIYFRLILIPRIKIFHVHLIFA